MAEAFPILLAAEMLPPELPQLGINRPAGELEGDFLQHLPLIAAALLLLTPIALALAWTRRRKRKRRTHRPRNPTLAQTGGLPPPRPQQ